MLVVEPIRPTSLETINSPAHQAPRDLPNTSLVSIEEEVESYCPTKPEIPSPDYLFKTLAFFCNLERLSAVISEMKSAAIDEITKTGRIAQAEATEKAQELRIQAGQVSMWDMLADMTGVMLAGISAVKGSSVLSTGHPVIGGLLISCGLLSAVNLTFKYTDTWNWLAKQTSKENKGLHQAISIYAPAAIGIFCAGVGLYGGYSLWPSIKAMGVSTLTPILESATSIAYGIVATGDGLAKKTQFALTGEVSFLQSMLAFNKLDLNKVAQQVIDYHKGQMDITKLVGEILSTRRQAIQITQQPV